MYYNGNDVVKRYKKPRRVKQKRAVIKKLLKNRFFWIGIFVVLFALGLSYAVFFSPVFQVEYIEVKGNQKVSTESIQELAAQLLGRKFLFFRVNNLFLLHSGSIQEQVRRAFPAIETVSVERKFPDSVVLIVSERKGVAIWCSKKIYTVEASDATKAGQRSFEFCFSLDQSGVVFEKKEEKDKVVIAFADNEIDVLLGEKIIDAGLLQTILGFQRELDAFPLFQGVGLRVSSLEIVSSDRVHAKISEGWEVYFNPTENVEWQITKLKLVLEREIPFEKRANLEYIDLRFGDQAYIKYR